jgi:hypothetical protein
MKTGRIVPRGQHHSNPHHRCHHVHRHSLDYCWSAWRYVLLLLPILLYTLGLPNFAISAGDISAGVEVDFSQESRRAGNVSFQQLEIASGNVADREYYRGMVVTLTGVYSGGSPDRFTLIKPVMTCCYADVRHLRAVVAINYKNIPSRRDRLVRATHNGEWVRVTGTVQFVQLDNGEYVTTLVVTPETPEDLHTLIKQLTGPPPDAFTS